MKHIGVLRLRVGETGVLEQEEEEEEWAEKDSMNDLLV